VPFNYSLFVVAYQSIKYSFDRENPSQLIFTIIKIWEKAAAASRMDHI
jgi:hypothetical protein